MSQPTAERQRPDPTPQSGTLSDSAAEDSVTESQDSLAAAPDTRNRPWRQSLRSSLTVWVVSHVALFLVTLVSFFQGNRPLPRSLPAAFGNWKNWDAEWFVWISQHGYTGYHHQGFEGNMDEGSSAAFFPLFSIIIRIVSFVGLHPFIAALLVATVAQIASFTILQRLTEQEINNPTAGRTLWYLVAFPTGFYLGIPYNASLYLLLAVSALYLMRRGVWWGAAAIGGLATATRSVALLLVIPFCYEYLRQHDFSLRKMRWDAAWVALIPTGISAFALYCWHAFGDPLKFSHIQSFWHRHWDWPWMGIYDSFRILLTTKSFYGNDVRNIVDLGAVLFVGTILVLCFVGPWKYRRDQWYLPIFGVATLLFIVSFPSSDPINRIPLLSAGRLCLEVFPAFMVMGRMGRNQTFDRSFMFIGLLFQAIWFAHFLLDHFMG